MSKLELLRPYLQHLDTCRKWSLGWWDNNQDCTCGLEDALIAVDNWLLEDVARKVAAL